jgi:hypothetical protein
MGDLEEWLGSLKSILFFLLAVLSVSSAYLFGISSFFSVGVRTLLDQKFFTNELLTFILFIAGLAAAIRIYVAASLGCSAALNDPSSFVFARAVSVGDASRSHTRVFVLLTFSVAIIYAGLRTSSKLFEPHLLVIWFGKLLLAFGVSSYLFVLLERRSDESLKVAGQRVWALAMKSPTSILTKPLVFALLASLMLFGSFSLGSTRILSLASAQDVCAVVAGGSIVGKLMGETSSGVLLKIGEVESVSYWNPFDAFLVSRNKTVYIDKESLAAIAPDCATAAPWIH